MRWSNYHPWTRRLFTAGVCLVSIAVSAIAESPSLEGTSSREVREQAARSLPFASLTLEATRKLKPVLEDPTVFRRMPLQKFACDPDLFNFLVRYPEVLVHIWQEMGVTKVETQRTGPYSFQGDDGAGTTSTSELIMGSDRLHIYYSEGLYEGPLVARKLEGRCICIVYGQASIGEIGQSMMTAHMDVFLKLDNVGADLIAKTISPLVVKTADYNYLETLRFVSQLSSAAQRDPEAVERLTARLDGLTPEVRQRFVQIANQAALRRDKLISAHWQQQLEKDGKAVMIGSPTLPLAPATQIK
jgi:hypothetical protein